MIDLTAVAISSLTGPGVKYPRVMRTPHRIALASSLAIGLAAPASAGAVETNEGTSLGFTISRFQDDFGMSATAGSPTFFRDTSRVTLGGGVAWFPERVLSDGSERWELYGHLRLVWEGGRRIEGLPLRLYGFGGPVLLLPPDTLTSSRAKLGGIGGFGFEFYMPAAGKDGPVSYLVEIGGIGTGAQADNVPGQPLFANGFLVAAGLRIYP